MRREAVELVYCRPQVVIAESDGVKLDFQTCCLAVQLLASIFEAVGWHRVTGEDVLSLAPRYSGGMAVVETVRES